MTLWVREAKGSSSARVALAAAPGAAVVPVGTAWSATGAVPGDVPPSADAATWLAPQRGGSSSRRPSVNAAGRFGLRGMSAGRLTSNGYKHTLVVRGVPGCIVWPRGRSRTARSGSAATAPGGPHGSSRPRRQKSPRAVGATLAPVTTSSTDTSSITGRFCCRTRTRV